MSGFYDKIKIAYSSLEKRNNKLRPHPPRVHVGLSLFGLDRPSESVQNWVTSGMDAFISPFVALSLSEDDVKAYNEGEDIFSHDYYMYGRKPSAVIASNGIKMVKGKKSIKKIEKKVEKKLAKRFANGGNGKKFKSFRRFGRRGRRGGAFMSGRGRVVRFGGNHERVVSQPLVRAVIGNAQRTIMRSKRANCMTVKTRVFLGTLYIDDNGGTGFVVNTSQLNGQYYFNPANATYMTAAGNLVTMSRMFQNYIIKNVKYQFKGLISTGNGSQYTINAGFFSDPNYGETVIPGFTTTTQLSADDVLNLPDAVDFPAWMPNKVIGPPRRFYNNKKFTVRSDEINNYMLTGTSPGQVALNRECYAFGMWLVVDGPTPSPGTSTPVSKIFMELEIDLCDMAPQMIYDATGGTSLSSTVAHVVSRPKPKEMKGVRSSADKKEKSNDLPSTIDYKTSFEDYLKWKKFHLDNIKLENLNLENLTMDDKWISLQQDDDVKSDIVSKKSSSLKSTKSDKNLN